MGDIATMQKLIRKGAVVDTKPVDGSPALFDAARDNKLEVLKVLLAAGAKVDLKKWGETPLTAAVGKGNIDAVELMLGSAGADVERRKYLVSQALAYTKKHPNLMKSQSRMMDYLEGLV